MRTPIHADAPPIAADGFPELTAFGEFSCSRARALEINSQGFIGGNRREIGGIGVLRLSRVFHDLIPTERPCLTP